MRIVATVSKCHCVTGREIMENKTFLSTHISTDEHGKFIMHAIEIIAKNKQAIAEQMGTKVPNEKMIAKARENIQNSINNVKIHVARLGATPDVVADIANDLSNDNIQQVTLKVLKLMANKNPGLHQRKYNQALQMVAAQQKQH